MRSTISGPGKCNFSFGIFGFLKFSRYSALSPSNFAIDVIGSSVSMFNFKLGPMQQAARMVSRGMNRRFDPFERRGDTNPAMFRALLPNQGNGIVCVQLLENINQLEIRCSASPVWHSGCGFKERHYQTNQFLR